MSKADELLDYIEVFRQLDLAFNGRSSPALVVETALNCQVVQLYGDLGLVSVTVRYEHGDWDVQLECRTERSDQGVEIARAAFDAAEAVVEKTSTSDPHSCRRALAEFVAAMRAESDLDGMSLAEYVIEGLAARADRERDDARRLPSPEGTPKKRFASTQT